MSQAPRPAFDGWHDTGRVYERYVGKLPDQTRVIVCTPDGWNWGFLAIGRSGDVVGGRVSSALSLSDAVEAAGRYIDGPVGEAGGLRALGGEGRTP